MHYIPNAELAFLSVDYIMREVPYGWLMRYGHSNGASMFFLVVYLHIAKAFFNSSFFYPRETTWKTGIIVFLTMILTAFLWLCITLGTNELLGSNCHNYFSFSCTCYRT